MGFAILSAIGFHIIGKIIFRIQQFAEGISLNYTIKKKIEKILLFTKNSICSQSFSSLEVDLRQEFFIYLVGALSWKELLRLGIFSSDFNEYHF